MLFTVACQTMLLKRCMIGWQTFQQRLPKEEQMKFRHGFHSQSIHGSLQHVSSSSPPLSLLADKCKSMHQLKQIHAQMILSSRVHDHFAASRLLSFSALSSSGDLSYATKLFNTIQNPNHFMWNTLVRAQATTQTPENAIFLYIQMTKSGFAPNEYTFPFVLKACSSCRSLNCCKQVHTHVLKSGLDFDWHVVNGLVRAYSVSNVLNDARKVFDQLTDKNLSLWTTMITGYAQNLRADEALVLFDRMVLEGFEPNSVTLASVLSACAQSGGLELGERLHVFIENKGLEMGVILGTALVHMYAKNGAILKAKKLFDSMPGRNVATWNAMICGSATHGHAEEALSLFREMEKEQIVPNDITFVGVLSACCHAGFIDAGREIFGSMKLVYGVEPKIEHYGCMVDLLGRGGMMEEAEELIIGMVWKADVVMLGALLTACKSYGNIEFAERLVEQMIVLEPNNHGVYVVLSNMYAEAGRWEDVMRLRKVMKVENLKKTAGWSLVGGDY